MFETTGCVQWLQWLFTFEESFIEIFDKNQEKEIERANIAVDETKVRIEQIKNDIDREKFLFEDAKQNLERVQEEKSILLKQQGDLFYSSKII